MDGQSFSKRKQADVLFVPCWQGKNPTLACKEPLLNFVKEAISSGDFTGKADSTCLVYPKGSKEKRILLLGLGEKRKVSMEQLRKSYATAVNVSRVKHKAHAANVLFPEVSSLNREKLVQAICEGLLLANYEFSELKGEGSKNDSPHLFKSFSLIGLDKEDLSIAAKAKDLIQSVYLARDVVNKNADEMTPQKIVSVAKEIAKREKAVRVTVMGKKELEKEGLGLLLAVGRASIPDPLLISIHYDGDPDSKESIAVVGKGITYDTGGLSLKPTPSMLGMKSDMGGAGAVLGIIEAAAKLKIKKNLIGVIPSTENSIGSKSYKIGDVYTAYNGKTVEITNTDAEGRLALADALSYTAKNYKPAMMIDLATLTGACVVALGEQYSALFTSNKAILKGMEKASLETGDLAWPLPLHADYMRILKSDFADFSNSGTREGGSITAALFLQEFTDGIPWAHLDIAGPAFPSKPFGYNPKNATGAGVRLLVEFLEKFALSELG